MNKEEIEAGNKIIAEWMGLSYCTKHLYEGWYKNYEHNYRICDYNGLKYHSDWNWLMGVYIKLSVELDIGWKITSKYVNIYTHIGQPVGDFDGRWGINCPDNVIVDAWRAIVSFIKWHNDNIQQNNKI